MIEPVALAMTRLGRFLRLLSPADRRLLVTAALLLAAIRLGLTLLPYRRLRKLVDRLARLAPRRQPAPPASAERIAWAVDVASPFVPGSTCLTGALATQVLLERRNHRACLYLGLTRTPAGEIKGHAWVESEKGVVIGGGDLSHYVPLVSWEGLPRGEGLRGR